MGKLNNHRIKKTCATLKTKRGKWGKCGSRKNGENEWRHLGKQRSTKQQNVGTIISFIDESIHVIHRLGAAGLGAAWWCCRTGNTVRVWHKGIPLCQQRQRMLHSFGDDCYYLVPSHQAHRDSAATPPLSNRAACHSALPSLTLPASWPHDAPCLAYVVLPIHLHCCSHLRHKHHLQHSPPPLYKDVDLHKSMHGTPDMCCTRCEPPACMWRTAACHLVAWEVLE